MAKKLPKKKPNMIIELAKLEAKAADYRTEFYTFFSLVLSFGVTIFMGFLAYGITLAPTSPSTGFQFFVGGVSSMPCGSLLHFGLISGMTNVKLRLVKISKI